MIAKSMAKYRSKAEPVILSLITHAGQHTQKAMQQRHCHIPTVASVASNTAAKRATSNPIKLAAGARVSGPPGHIDKP
jgi:hypothetical protein